MYFNNDLVYAKKNASTLMHYEDNLNLEDFEAYAFLEEWKKISEDKKKSQKARLRRVALVRKINR